MLVGDCKGGDIKEDEDEDWIGVELTSMCGNPNDCTIPDACGEVIGVVSNPGESGPCKSCAALVNMLAFTSSYVLHMFSPFLGCSVKVIEHILMSTSNAGLCVAKANTNAGLSSLVCLGSLTSMTAVTSFKAFITSSKIDLCWCDVA